jgi:hypothetical protein
LESGSDGISIEGVGAGAEEFDVVLDLEVAG